MGMWSCTEDTTIKPDHILSADKKHNKFSKLIPPSIKSLIWCSHKSDNK